MDKISFLARHAIAAYSEKKSKSKSKHNNTSVEFRRLTHVIPQKLARSSKCTPRDQRENKIFGDQKKFLFSTSKTDLNSLKRILESKRVWARY